MTSQSWTPERDAELTRLWADPALSTRRIGEAMGRNKNSVVGRAHRLGLPGRASPILAPKPVAVSSPPGGHGFIRRAALPKPAAPPAPRVTLSPHRICQWIDGQPAGAATLFCCLPVQRGSSYCPAHHARCWHPFVPKAKAA